MSRVLIVRVRDTYSQRFGIPTGNDYRYGIRETSFGELVWRHLGRFDEKKGPGNVFLPRCGAVDMKSVLPEEAERLTGLRMPAAMDALRELVQESPPLGDRT